MRWLRTVLMMAAIPATARAQTTSQTPAPPVTAGWEDGFVLQTPNGDNRLVLGLTLQVDGRFPVGDSDSPSSTFSIRRMRPTFSGRIAKYFDFRVMPDF